VVVPNGPTDVIRIFVPDALLTKGVGSSWLLLGMLAVALIAVAVAVADRLGRSVVRPMGELADAAERLGNGDLEVRVEPAGPPEVVETGQTLNRLAGRITALLAAEREAAADLSHRLRTPVTALRLDVDGLHDPTERERIGADVDALARAVDRLITEARRPMREGVRARSDLTGIAAERVAFWAALAEDQGRTYAADLPGRGRTRRPGRRARRVAGQRVVPHRGGHGVPGHGRARRPRRWPTRRRRQRAGLPG